MLKLDSTSRLFKDGNTKVFLGIYLLQGIYLLFSTSTPLVFESILLPMTVLLILFIGAFYLTNLFERRRRSLRCYLR